MSNAVKEMLERVIDESGLWAGERRKTHGFLLSASVYRLTLAMRQELEHLGHALADCMLGLSHIAVIAYDPKMNYQGAWMLARRVFSTGVPHIYQELQGMNVRHIPKLTKVDLMVNQQGRFRIAEIDGHNKHGVGYATLCRQFRDALRPNVNALPGLVNKLSEEVKRQGKSEIKLFFADHERFYLPEFEVAAREFGRHDIKCQVVGEMQATVEFLREGLFLDLPFLYHRRELYQTIISAYKEGAVGFIIPPKPFFGAKGVMALLRNDGGNEELEALLKSFIRKESLKFVRSYIPETLLVGKNATRASVVREYVSQVSLKKYVLKESISSGMKGIFFSDDEDFEAALLRADRSSMNWILQEQVENQPQTFSWFEDGNTQEQMSGGWYMRVIAQYASRNLADVIITARRHRAVHGGKDCIQLGSVITN